MSKTTMKLTSVLCGIIICMTPLSVHAEKKACKVEKKLKYELLPTGATKPRGWMLNQLQLDLKDGITGNYDRYHSNVAGDLFAKQNRAPGKMIMGSRGRNEKAWWAGEHEGYWHDGLLRTAILVDDDKTIERVRNWINEILDRYDETGYIGIYSPESRFPDEGYDGELWTQSRTFEALLAWVEYSGDKRVLDAVIQTVHKTIDHYRELGTYFGRPKPDGGVWHGVGYLDTLEWLWRLTGDKYYAEASVWMYDDYNAHCTNHDLQVDNMLQPNKRWGGHTPHTGETLHLPGIAAFFSGNEKFLKVSQNVPGKLAYHTNPGGGFVAGKEMWEAIGGAMGGGDKADEYCAKTETLITLSRLFQYEGNTFSGDWGEHCALNAAQGARFHPANTASIYLSRDNRLSADKPDLHSGREMYSAGHRTAACCTLNATRLMPSYVAAMWYRCVDRPGLFANLYGASELTTTINKIPVRIDQETNYPFSDKITFHLEPKQPTSFDLVLRIPPNCGDIRVEADGVTVNRSDKSICISKNWKHGDTVNVDFDFQVARQLQLDGKQAYYEWGPLVFSLPIKANIERWTEIERDGKKTKTGFYDYTISPVDKKPWATIDNTEASMRKIDLSDGDMKTPWAKPFIGLKGTLRTVKGDPVEVTLVPLGCTVLRRTTFPLNAEFARQAAEANKGEFFSDEEDPMRDF